MTMLALSPDTPAAVRTTAVVKRYGPVTALDGLDLVVPTGAIYLLAGPNGAGKTTAIRHLLHLEEPDQGVIEVLGHDLGAGAVQVRTCTGVICDDTALPYGWMRVAEAVAHHARYFPTWDAAYAARLVAELELQPTRKLSELSRGNRRRLDFVLALAHRPALLLLDEPTDGLDPVIRERVLHRLAAHVAESETTVVVATHLVHEVERLADHVGILRRGRLAAQMTRDRLRATLNRYRFDAPDGWRPPDRPELSILTRATSGREHEWTMWGDPDALREILGATGIQLRSIAPLTLADAVVTLLATEVAA